MALIRDKISFFYDGVSSKNFDLVSVTLDNGLYEEQFVADREIVETGIRGGNPILHSIEGQPLEFELILAFEKDFTEEKLDAVVEWLYKDYYRPLYFEGAESRQYMCMPVESSSLAHNGIQQGYFKVKMRCNSQYLYSPTKITTNTVVGVTPVIIEIDSDTQVELYPELSILKEGSGSVRIEKLDESNQVIQTFLLENLSHMENLYVNGKREIIQTDIIGVYRYDSVFGRYLSITKGNNRFRVTGNCNIQFRYQNIYKR